MANEMKISLNLKKHCVETEIKRLYNKHIAEYFKSQKKGEVEELINMLLFALENWDFPFLRKNYAELAGDSKAEVILAQDDKGTPTLLISGERVL